MRIYKLGLVATVCGASAVGCDDKAADSAQPAAVVDDTGSRSTVDDTGDSGGPPDPGDAFVIDLTIGPVYPGYTDLAVFPGLAGVPNLDDDDEDGREDWAQAGMAAGENDFALATITTQGRDLQLSLRGSGVRIYGEDGILLGEGSASEALLSGIETAALRVEFADFLDQAVLTVTDEARSESVDLALTASPLFFNHHLQPSERTMALRVAGFGYNNREFIEAYEDAFGDAFIRASGGRYNYDVWIQDEFEFGYATAPDAHLDVIFDTHRNGQGGPGDGLDDFPEDEYEGPDWLITNWGPRDVYSLDYGGNFEISPPVTVDGVHYPYGRVYYGGIASYQPLAATQQAVERMQVQKPFMPDSTWLCVGHIDEFTTTIPDPSSPKGFRFVIADTDAAWEILDALDPMMGIPQYSGGAFEGHYMDTIEDMVSDAGLRYLNEEIQETLDEQKALFMRELGLVEEDIIYMPSLFEEVSGCGGLVAALIPGMANLIIADVDGAPTAFIPDPFIRSDLNDQSTDPVIAAVRAIFPESLGTVFVDDWSVYHMGLGEVHCGTNVEREADNEWWTDAGHLITQEVAR